MIGLALLLLACAGDTSDPELLDLGTVYDPEEVEGDIEAPDIEGDIDAPAVEIIEETPPAAADDDDLPAEITDVVQIDGQLVDLDPQLLAALNEAIDQTAVRTAEEITSRGPMGGGIAGLSQPQIKALLSLLFDVVISAIGVLLLRWLPRVRQELLQGRAEAGRVSAERQRDREEVARLRAHSRQLQQHLDAAKAAVRQHQRAAKATAAKAQPAARQPAQKNPPGAGRVLGEFEQLGHDLLHGKV